MPLTNGIISHWLLNEVTKPSTVKTSGVVIPTPLLWKDELGRNDLALSVVAPATVQSSVRFHAASKAGWADPYCYRNYGGLDTVYGGLKTYLRHDINSDFQLQSEDYTWCGWFYLEDNIAGQLYDGLLGNYTETGSLSYDYAILCGRPGGSPQVSHRDYLNNRAFSGRTIVPGTWHMLTAWRTSGLLLIAVDDEIDNPISITGNPRNFSYTRFVLGAAYPRSGGLEKHAAMRMSSLSLWGRTLTSAERTALWNGGAGLHYSSFANYSAGSGGGTTTGAGDAAVESSKSDSTPLTYTDVVGETTATIIEDATISDIKTELEARGFSCSLSLSNYTSGIIPAALRKLGEYYPITAFATFLTAADMQEYKIFDKSDPQTGGFAVDANKIQSVLWNPGGDWTSLNLFSPGWQMLSQQIIFTGSYFHQPSLMISLRQKLDYWNTQFGSQGFDIIGAVGSADSLLKLYPTPTEADTVVGVAFTKRWALADINDAAMPYFMEWVEYYAADTLANKYAKTAGIELFEFSDSAEAVKHWRGKADKYYATAINNQGGTSKGIVARS